MSIDAIGLHDRPGQGVGQYLLERWLAMTPNHGISSLLDGPPAPQCRFGTLSFRGDADGNDFALEGFNARVSTVSSLCTPRPLGAFLGL
jgi:hypothetical protein